MNEFSRLFHTRRAGKRRSERMFALESPAGWLRCAPNLQQSELDGSREDSAFPRVVVDARTLSVQRH